MKKIFTILIFGMLLLSVSLVFAHEHDFNETKQIIDSGISCDKLTDEQLESIGDYYMEQMHPGKAHEMMDQMIGGEGSDSLKQVHIQMAKRLYCNDDVGGMMNMMGYGMMGNNIMGSSIGSSSWWLWNVLGVLFWIALLVALILLIIWLYKKITKKSSENGSVLEILKKRYAKGEINKREYESMKKELRK